jgi:hypothetical protein
VSRHSIKASGDTRDHDVDLDDLEWQRIESACGWSIQPAVRSKILHATKQFLLFEPAERTVQSVSAAKINLEAYDKAATRFFNALFVDPSGPSDASAYAQSLIEQNSSNLRQSGVSVFEALLANLRTFHIACNTSIKQLNDPVSSAFQSGRAWRQWVVQLTDIVDGASLPTAVRKDVGGKSKNDDQSPFARFVSELQKILPEESQRHTHSEGALADAISEARKSGGITPGAEGA